MSRKEASSQPRLRHRARKHVRRARLAVELAGWGSAAVGVVELVENGGPTTVTQTATTTTAASMHVEQAAHAATHAPAPATPTPHPSITPGSGGGGFIEHFLTHPPHLSSGLVIGGAVLAGGALYGADYVFRRARSDDGMASRRDLKRRLTAKAILKDVRTQLPELDRLAREGKLTPTRYALPLGKCPSPRMNLSLPYKDVGTIVAPAQTGKSSLLGNFAIDAPGAVLCTNTKLDLYRTTAGVRAQRGRVWLMNTEGQGGIASNFRWSPITGCEHPVTAMENAAAIVAAAGGADDVTDGSYWLDKAEKLLATMLHAAALDERTMHDVWAWATDQDDTTPADILETKPGAGKGWAKLFRSIQQLDPRQAGSIYSTLSRGLSFMLNPDIAELVVPDEEHPAIDLASFILSRDTIYLVGENTPGSNIAPLFLGFVSALHRLAKRLATHQPGGRLDPPLTLLIDEAALICPIPLDAWAADSGGRGICLWVAVQAMSQLEQRYGLAGARTIRGASNVTIVLGGVADDTYLDGVSKLFGEKDVAQMTETAHPSNGTSRGGISRSTSYRRERVVSPDAIRELPMWHGLLIYRNLKPTVINYRPVWEHPSVKALTPPRQRRFTRTPQVAVAVADVQDATDGD